MNEHMHRLVHSVNKETEQKVRISRLVTSFHVNFDYLAHSQYPRDLYKS